MQYVGVQVDVTSKTEGTSTGDQSGVPLLVKYDTRLKESGKHAVNEINTTVQVKSGRPFELYGLKRHQAALDTWFRRAMLETSLHGFCNAMGSTGWNGIVWRNCLMAVW